MTERLDLRSGREISVFPIQLAGHEIHLIRFREHPLGDPNHVVMEIPEECDNVVVLPRDILNTVVAAKE